MSYQTETSNYCRTPENDNDNAGGPWCYVNETRGWNRCNIPVCGGAVCPALLGNLETLDRKHRYQYGESVILSCKLGYKLIGNRYLTCLPSGQWNDTIPRCDVLCSNNPCKNGGTCTDGVKGHTCTCRDNNFGINCQYDIVKCSNNPCKHGGTCTDGVKGHTCTCRDNNFGINCQYDKQKLKPTVQ
ncbi:delta-like protein B [Mytilus trossulus]|uniref:delta-like protein B n=1 Tax=Mytilus trossulus TaxID=6551 RepID=UPI003007EA97